MDISTFERIDQLLAIKNEFKTLLHQAETLLSGTSEERRAQAYWLAHIRCALDADHGYLSRDITMQSSIEALADWLPADAD